MPAPTSITVSDLYPGITDLLMGRVMPSAKMAEAIRKTALELSEDYWIEGLQETGPVVQLVQNQVSYSSSFFKQPADGTVPVTKVQSFFIYNNPYVDPSAPTFEGVNSGYDLVYKSIERIETLINTRGMPTNWTRHGGLIWIGCMPDNTYSIYMRYQHEHPFPQANSPNAGTDIIYFSRSWQDILEMASAQRLAETYNLSSKATELNTRLLGDQKFQSSGGVSGSPGLIFKRTSEYERDQTTTVRRFRLRMRSSVS